MICLKNKLTLILLSITTTLTVTNTCLTIEIAKAVEEFEPVVIERIVEVPVEPEAPVIEEPIIEETVVKEPSVVEVIPPRINCRLDDETQQMIYEKSKEYNIDFSFTMAVIFKESSFRVNADSGSSVGLMQINRINHEWLSKELGITDFFDPEQNVTAGLYMLNQLFQKYDDPARVLMAYNMGETGAKRRWDQGIYTSDYAEGVLQYTEIYNAEIAERMGEK